jgi:hypothetical protein
MDQDHYTLSSFTRTVYGCAACGETHPIRFYPVAVEAKGRSAVEWAGYCPSTQRKVYAKMHASPVIPPPPPTGIDPNGEYGSGGPWWVTALGLAFVLGAFAALFATLLGVI